MTRLRRCSRLLVVASFALLGATCGEPSAVTTSDSPPVEVLPGRSDQDESLFFVEERPPARVDVPTSSLPK